MTEINEILTQLNFNHYAPLLSRVGIRSITDIVELDEKDWNKLKIPNEHREKILNKIAQIKRLNEMKKPRAETSSGKVWVRVPRNTTSTDYDWKLYNYKLTHDEKKLIAYTLIGQVEIEISDLCIDFTKISSINITENEKFSDPEKFKYAWVISPLNLTFACSTPDQRQTWMNYVQSKYYQYLEVKKKSQVIVNSIRKKPLPQPKLRRANTNSNMHQNKEEEVFSPAKSLPCSSSSRFRIIELDSHHSSPRSRSPSPSTRDVAHPTTPHRHPRPEPPPKPLRMGEERTRVFNVTTAEPLDSLSQSLQENKRKNSLNMEITNSDFPFDISWFNGVLIFLCDRNLYFRDFRDSPKPPPRKFNSNTITDIIPGVPFRSKNSDEKPEDKVLEDEPKPPRKRLSKRRMLTEMKLERQKSSGGLTKAFRNTSVKNHELKSGISTDEAQDHFNTTLSTIPLPALPLIPSSPDITSSEKPS